jgi:integrase
VSAKQPQCVPVVLSREEVRAVLARISGDPRLVSCLLYGSRLRLLEACRLRVKDLDFYPGASPRAFRQGRQGPVHRPARIRKL